MKKLLTLIALVLFVSAPTVMAVAPTNTRAEERAAARLEKAEEIKTRVEELKAARTEQKAQLETQLVARVKTKANGEIDRIAARYDRLIALVNKLKVVSDERKAEFETKVMAAKEELLAYKTKVEEATTVQEVRAVMTELRTKAKGNSELVKEMVAAIHATHLDNIVAKLTAILDKLETKGGDMESIAAARTQLEEATEIIKTGDFKAAREKILEARKTMIEIAKVVNADGNEDSTESEESTEEESEETTTESETENTENQEEGGM